MSKWIGGVVGYIVALILRHFVWTFVRLHVTRRAENRSTDEDSAPKGVSRI
jgi:hypothetical protein